MNVVVFGRILLSAFLLTVCCSHESEVFEYNQFLGHNLEDDTYMHEFEDVPSTKNYDQQEDTAEYWINQAELTITEKLENQPITNIAKNVIMFLGDGMSIPTLAATRAYLGQRNNRPGEETQLSFEKFPYSGLSKTYCIDSQVADSACSATAYLSGIKANRATIGVTGAVPRKSCKSMQNTTNHVYSVAYWSQLKGKRTGLVTTTRVTHASPAGVYAHTAERNWEHITTGNCSDIATQLVHGETGKNLNIILGGGRGEFVPIFQKDDVGQLGKRLDKRNLINEWKTSKANSHYEYVWNKTALLEVPYNTEFLLGLFSKDHMPYNLDRDEDETPSLAEMTETAIKLLSQGENGYFLFVEGGKIDHAHHKCAAQKALDETVEFAKAIQTAVDLTDMEDTLIVVTSDHAHTMSLNGYPSRGNNILGIAGNGLDQLPYSTLSYANGLGYRKEKDGKRHDMSEDDYNNKNYRYPALAPRSSETHGGDDVGIFTRGPWAHLLTGVVEQNVIAHVMKYASCVGNGIVACDQFKTK